MLVNGGSLQWLNHFPRNLVMLRCQIASMGLVYLHTLTHTMKPAHLRSRSCAVYTNGSPQDIYLPT